MELDEVQPFQPEVGSASIHPGPKRLRRVLSQVEGHTPAHLCRYEEGFPTSLAQELAYDLLTPTVAVDVGRVDQSDAGICRRMERAQAFIVVDVPPVGADGPRAEADCADFTTGLAKPAVLQRRISFLPGQPRGRPLAPLD